METKVINYKTGDLYFAAFLVASGFGVKTTEKSEGKDRLVFVFEIKNDLLQKKKGDFFGGKGMVVVQKYVQALKSLKSMLYT